MSVRAHWAPLHTLHEIHGDDEQCRRQFSLNTFAERERDSVPDILYYYWDALRGDGRRIPRVHDFRPKETFNAAINLYIRSVDVSSEDPGKFLFRDHHGGPINLVPGGLDGKPMSAFPSRIHVNATLAEYDLCKRLGRPLYHELNQVICGMPRHYTRILLPLADDEGRVVRLTYGLRLLRLYDYSQSERIG